MIVLALLPGALYVWSFERQTGRWGIGLSDRVLRFIGTSAILHVAFAPLTYLAWVHLWPAVDEQGSVPWGLWLVTVAFVALPVGAGWGVGWGAKSSRNWSSVFTGPAPAPRAWDFLFQGNKDGWIRLKLKSGTWVAGAYATSTDGVRSYSAGYPEEQDLFLATMVTVDSESGEFLVDENGNAMLEPGGLLVQWSEVEYLQFIDA